MSPGGRGQGPGGATLLLFPTAHPTHHAPCRFWFRLYWFPLKVLYATCHCSLRSVPDIPFYFFFNALLLLLTLMNLYWFLVSWLPRTPCPPTRPHLAVVQAQGLLRHAQGGNSIRKGLVAGAQSH